MAIEEEFAIEIPDEEADAITSVGQGESVRSEASQRFGVSDRRGRIPRKAFARSDADVLPCQPSNTSPRPPKVRSSTRTRESTYSNPSPLSRAHSPLITSTYNLPRCKRTRGWLCLLNSRSDTCDNEHAIEMATLCGRIYRGEWEARVSGCMSGNGLFRVTEPL